MPDKEIQNMFTAVTAMLGRVPIGSASVFIQVLCPHRDQAFAGCRYLIDELKVDVPIWKCEIWERGRTTWKDGEIARR